MRGFVFPRASSVLNIDNISFTIIMYMLYILSHSISSIGENTISVMFKSKNARYRVGNGHTLSL